MNTNPTAMIDRKMLALLKPMDADEKAVYWSACLEFGENRTYRMTAEPLRSQLMHEYGMLAVNRYNRKRAKRRRRRT